MKPEASMVHGPTAGSDKAPQGHSSPLSPKDLPAVDRLLRDPAVAGLVQQLGAHLVTEQARALLQDCRALALAGQLGGEELARLPQQLATRCRARLAPRMRNVFNLTGTVIHTNLGRALLADSALQQLLQCMAAPNNLEYDLASGGRGDRDDLVPGVSDRAWRQVSVSARECLGATNCSYGEDCFAEQSRRKAALVDLVVTNHAMLAIDAMSPATILPEHDVVVVDEAHELVDRITSVSTDELSAASIALIARRCGKLIDEETTDALLGAGEQFGEFLNDVRTGEWTTMPSGGDAVFASLRDRLWQAHTAIGPVRGAGQDADSAAARSAALTSLENTHDAVVRLLGAFDEQDMSKRRDVVWVSAEPINRAGETRRVLCMAPLSVGGLLRSSLFAGATVILTSATLTIGGNFDALAVNWGLPAHGGGTSGAAVLSAFRLEMHWRVSPRMVTASGLSVRPAVICGVGSATFDGMTTTLTSIPAGLKKACAIWPTEAAASPESPMRMVNFLTPAFAAVTAWPLRTATEPPESM